MLDEGSIGRTQVGVADVLRMRPAQWFTLMPVAIVLALAVLNTTVTASWARAWHVGGIKAASGSLNVRIVGLPPGQPINGVLHGPGGLVRSVSVAQLTISKTRAGVYRLTLRPVTIGHTRESIEKGAIGRPVQRTTSVRVHAGHHASLVGTYGSIINPGVKTLHGGVVSVTGPPENPTSVLLSGHRTFAPRAIISMAPDVQLPRGLLSHVVAVSYRAGNTLVSLRTASIYEVAPNFQFNVPLQSSRATAADFSADCGLSSGLSPYRRIKDVSFSGGWSTADVFGVHITDGVRADVHFMVEAGIEVTAGAGLSCSLSLAFYASGLAGPIPVTAGIEGDLTGSAGVGGVLDSGGSIEVEAGGHTVGFPPTMLLIPDVSFSSPHFMLTAKQFAQVTAGIGLTVKAGIGAGGVASLTLNVGSSLNFTAQPASCLWDAKFGQFSAEGELLDWHLSTPQTPALFTRQLGGNFCPTSSTGEGGAGSGGSGGGSSGGGGAGGSDVITLTNPGNQSGTVGVPVHLQIEATDAQDATLTYSATGLPFGLTMEPSTGLITGTPKAAGNATVTLTVENGRGQVDSLIFPWLVSLAPGQLGWTVEPLAMPVGAQHVALDAVSCAEATACVGVGSSEGSTPGATPLAETWNGSTWTVSSVGNSHEGVLNGVSCPASDWCAAVGERDGGQAEIAETWNGSGWTEQTISAPPSSQSFTLLGVSCTSPSHCIAVGYYVDDAGGYGKALAEDWNGSAWTEGNAVAPNPRGSPYDANSFLYAISCASPTSCVAVGEYEDEPDDTDPALAESWNGSAWTVDSPPTIPHAFQTHLSSVSCWEPDSCMAVGAYDIAGNPPPEGNTVSESWDGSAWHQQSAPVLPETFSELHGVSCTSATFCAGLGYGSPGASYDALWNGAWSYEAFGTALDAVSCVTETYCVAVGTEDAAVYTSS
jgi:hypothetical protein